MALNSANEAARKTFDRGEAVSSMEPLRIPEGSPRRPELTDLAFELVRNAASFRRSLSPGMLPAIEDLVRSVNCYYSNLIEGHDTHPVEIERAVRNDFSADPRTRNLQLEAKAHIAVEQWIDDGALAGHIASAESIREIHRRFGDLLPEESLFVEAAGGERVRVEPGELRTRDVEVGRHRAISPGAVPRFLERFEQGYGKLGKAEAVLAAAAAHHRLLWIHPFLEGTGRVARLMSHAWLLETLDSGVVWSVARGLARNVVEYKQLLDDCDQPRRNDLDGSAALSEEALAHFTRFFLSVCLDQVAFMESRMQPNRLRMRILLWAEEQIRLGTLPAKSEAVLEAVLSRGELPRGDAATVTGASERSARRVVSALLSAGVLTSEGSRAPLRLTFPAAVASRWLPGLYPDAPIPASRS